MPPDAWSDLSNRDLTTRHAEDDDTLDERDRLNDLHDHVVSRFRMQPTHLLTWFLLPSATE